MKRCEYCRSYVKDDELKCPNCGASVVELPSIQPQNSITETITDRIQKETVSKNDEKPDILLRLSIVFLIVSMIIACSTGAFAISLFWKIPITLSLRKKIYHGIPISLFNKIVVLIFGSIVAGILLLCYQKSDDNVLM